MGEHGGVVVSFWPSSSCHSYFLSEPADRRIPLPSLFQPLLIKLISEYWEVKRMEGKGRGGKRKERKGREGKGRVEDKPISQGVINNEN